MLDDPIISELPLDAWPIWAQALFWFWIALFGAAIGSFLNVVIYRAPRGMSLVHPGSHCPKCGHAIRARDNLPVLGWILLRGKCRDCATAISARYPTVEALVGLLFVGIAALYLGWEGASLPATSAELNAAWSERQLAGIAAFHLLLVMLLFCAAGMRFDGQTMPRWIVALIAVVGISLPCIWPWLRPVASGLSNRGPAPEDALIDGILGAAVGWVVGCVRFADFRSNRSWKWNPSGDRQLYGVVGAMLGWQAAIAVALVSTIFGLVLICVARRRPRLVLIPDEFGLLLATLIVLCSWRWGASILAGSELETWQATGIPIFIIATLGGWEGAMRLVTQRKLAPAAAKRKK